MLIIALVLAAIGLAALVFAVVTSNALVAWVCIGASLLGVLLLIVDALRERRAHVSADAAEAPEESVDADLDADVAEVESTDAADAGEAVGFDTAVGFDAEATDEPVDESTAHPADQP